MSERWWDKFRDGPDPEAVAPTAKGEPVSCPREGCDWAGAADHLIDHPKIEHLLCPRCLQPMPGTYRRPDVAHCPNCNSTRMTPDGKACCECDWPEIEISGGND